MASLWNLPAVYIIENNRYGMGTACTRAVSVADIAAAKAPGYGMRGLTIHDGLDLYECWKVAQEAVAIARSGRPVLVEAKTYRYRGHSVSDVAAYRTKEEVESYRSRDPIARLAQDLVAHGLATSEALEAMLEEVNERIHAATAFALDSPEPPLSDLSSSVYAP